MEELLAVILLTLINVIEILYMITGSMLPLAAVLIFFILILVFMAVFMMRRKLFWAFAMLAFIINILNLGYMFLSSAGAVALYLALFINLAGILFAAMHSGKLLKTDMLSKRRAPRRLAFRADDKMPVPADDAARTTHSHMIEDFIRQLEENERLNKQSEPAVVKPSALKAQAQKKTRIANSAKKAAVKKRFSPGKFVASKTGRQYHKPRCDWANNIKKQNRVWFASEKQAEKKGYTAHWCLKKK